MTKDADLSTKSDPVLRKHPSRPKDNSPWWRKLFSSNWWWYGEVHPDPATLPALEQQPRYWRPHMWFFVVFWVWLLGAPLASSYLNDETPTEAQLQTLQGQVIAVNKKSPHMQIKLESGAVVDAEFPVKVMFWGGVSQRRFFDYQVQEKVLACKDVQISGVYLRYVPFERFRIWDLGCKDGSTVISLEVIQLDWKSSYGFGNRIDSGITLFVLILFLLVNYIRERKDHARKN